MWQQLSKETKDGDVAEKFGIYQHANKQVDFPKIPFYQHANKLVC